MLIIVLSYKENHTTDLLGFIDEMLGIYVVILQVLSGV